VQSEPTSIGELVRRWAELTPDAAAIAAVGGEPLTFRGLAEQLSRTELQLRDAGIGGDARVALVLDNGPELATAFLGVAAAAACAPLNPAYRAHELDFYLADLGASAVVVRAGARTPAREAAERAGAVVLELEPTGAGRFTLEPRGRPAAETGTGPRDDVALLLHTSGTTARPKLVPLTHASLCASAASIAGTLALTRDDRALTVMPLFHIHGLVASVLAPLAAGSTIIATPGFDAVRFLDWLAASGPTWYSAVPTMHMAVLDRARGSQQACRDAGLRFVRSSSAALPTSVLEELEQVFGCPVIEAYGMTEASHQMASNPLPPLARKPGSVGIAAGPEIAVLDEAGQEVTPGALGEVAVRGPGVFGGYESNPEATAAAFTNGWFRTGDEGYLDEDGYVFLRGRLKELVNRGGEKISPREVEDALLAHPSVAEAVVFAQPHERLGEDVAAAVVLHVGGEVTAPELQRLVATQLAPFKVPRTILFQSELPKGATGKVQRVGLAERLGLPVLRAEAVEVEYVAPGTELERRLCELYEELLGVPRVGVEDDFFALGGDSLHVAQLLATVDDELGRETETLACVLLRAPTPAALAALLEDDGPREPVVRVGPDHGGRPFYFFPTHDWATVGLGALAQRLTSDRVLYTFQPDLAGLTADGPNVAGLAERFAEDIRSAQPRGPYELGGHCFGAALALEVARILSRDDEVSAVVLLNPIGERKRIGTARWAIHHARHGTLHEWLGRRLRPERREATRSIAPSLAGVVRALDLAGDAYAPTSYPGAITVVASADYLTPRRFWARRAQEVTWLAVPGHTDALFRPPFLDTLAAAVDRALDDDLRDAA
jgi:acyl-CoA synthetase (AMP-forming)/AMP-acid ligase II/thioesterase domain-containing protein